MNNEELKGVLFPRTKTNDKQPDFKGSAMIGGVEYYVAGWKRTSKAGAAYMSLAFQKKGEEQKKATPNHQAEVEQVAQAVNKDAWEEVPF